MLMRKDTNRLLKGGRPGKGWQLLTSQEVDFARRCETTKD